MTRSVVLLLSLLPLASGLVMQPQVRSICIFDAPVFGVACAHMLLLTAIGDRSCRSARPLALRLRGARSSILACGKPCLRLCASVPLPPAAPRDRAACRLCSDVSHVQAVAMHAGGVLTTARAGQAGCCALGGGACFGAACGAAETRV